jgi:hypothetical protein
MLMSRCVKALVAKGFIDTGLGFIWDGFRECGRSIVLKRASVLVERHGARDERWCTVRDGTHFGNGGVPRGILVFGARNFLQEGMTSNGRSEELHA